MPRDESAETTERDANEARKLVEEAYELAEKKLEQDEVTSEDVVEVGHALREASEHPDAGIFVTMTAHGPANQCEHHKYPDGPYSYPPVESPRECLRGIVDHEIEVSIN